MHTWTHNWPEVASIVGRDETTSNVYPHLHATDIVHELLRVTTHQRGRHHHRSRLFTRIPALMTGFNVTPRDRRFGSSTSRKEGVFDDECSTIY